jgi:short-subunit dehydrogenase
MRPHLSQQAVVVTGASSGIGRETAIHLGARGARVVLAARNAEALEAAAREVEQAGGQARHVVTDVSEWDQVDHLAGEAVREFGRIDTWINAAGISLYADIAAATPDEMKRVIDVNLVGEMFGTKAAFEQMRRQGGGVIINVSSALARRSVPLQAAYCASKHGITGFTEAVRLELQQEYPGIDLVEVLPSSINTPLFHHARSKLGVKPMPIPPIYAPSVVAEAIVHACEHPQREIVVGGAGKAFVIAQQVSAGLVDRYLLQGGRGVRQQLSDQPDDGQDNLFEPLRGRGSTTGDWSEQAHRSSIYTHLLEFHPGRKLAMMAAAAGAALLLVRRVGR